MKNFLVSSDSTCDIQRNQFGNLGIEVIPLTFITDINKQVEEHLDEFDNESQYKEFYEKLSTGMTAKTSQLTTAELETYFRDLIDKYKCDIIHTTLSSGLSGTYQQAVVAGENISREKDFNVYVIDSKAATVGHHLLVDYAIKLRDEGKTSAEAYKLLTDSVENIHQLIMIDDIDHLKRGGRISSDEAEKGKMLNIKPFITFNHLGKLVTTARNRGTNKSIEHFVEQAKTYANNTDKFFIAHACNIETANKLAEALKKAFNKPSVITFIGPVIGAHLGPESIFLSFYGKERPVINE